MSFDSPSAQTLRVSESGYSGSFSAASSDSSVATVMQGQDGSHFTVTPVGGGTATIIVTDANKQILWVSVTVTSATIIPQLQP